MKRVVFMMLFFIGTLLLSSMAFAEEIAKAATGGDSLLPGALAIASGFGIGIAVFGGALAQARAAAAALEGIARNPEASAKVQMPMIIALALIESLVIYALVIAFLLQGKI